MTTRIAEFQPVTRVSSYLGAEVYGEKAGQTDVMRHAGSRVIRPRHRRGRSPTRPCRSRSKWDWNLTNTEPSNDKLKDDLGIKVKIVCVQSKSDLFQRIDRISPISAVKLAGTAFQAVHSVWQLVFGCR